MRIVKGMCVALLICVACDKTTESTAKPGDTAADAEHSAYEPVIDETSPSGEHPEEDALNKLAAASVLWNHKDLKSEDAGSLNKIRAALMKTTPQMYVHVARDVDKAAFAPAPRKIGNTEHAGGVGYWPAEETWSADAEGLLGHGGVAIGSYKEGQGNWIKVHRPKNYPPALAKNTPGVVWEVDGSTVWFVALDGGRYRLAWDDLALGLPTRSAWPKPLQHGLLSDEDVDFLSRTGAMPKSAHKELTGINEAFNRCTEDGWKDFKKEIDKLAKKNLTGSTRHQRAELARSKREESVKKSCAKHVAAMDAALVKLIEARNAERKKLYAQASKRSGG